MKRKTTILLSSILAGSLLVGGAFAAYAVTDNANAIKVQVTPGAPVVPDTQVVLSWGEKVHANISGLERNKLERLAYVTVESDVDYEGIFSVLMEDATEGKVPNSKALFDYLEVYTYQGKVDLDEGEIPEGAVELEELRILPATPVDDDGNKGYDLHVASDSDGKQFSIFIKLVCAEEDLGEMTDDVVEFTLDWGMNDDGHSHPATPSEVPATDPGYYLVGTLNGWEPYTSAKFSATNVEGELLLSNVTLAATDEFKAYQIVNEGDPVWIPGGDAANLTAPAGTYDILFAPVYRADWESDKSDQGMFGRGGHFWMIPKSSTPEPGTSEEPGTSQEPGTSVTPAGMKAITATTEQDWAFNKDQVDLFAWAWEGENPGAWHAVGEYASGLSVTFNIPENADHFLLVRCPIGTETPNWQATGDDAGRIYNKTADIVIGTETSYAVTFVDYEYIPG